MARARVVVDDAGGSLVVEQLRRTLNGLLLMLESAEASITAGASAEDVLNAFADAVRTAKDNNPASISNIAPSNAELLGVKTTPRIPRGVKGPEEVMTVDEV